MIMITLVYALMAASFTIAKAALSYTAPIFFVAVRMICAGLLLLGFCWLRNPQSLRIRKQEFFPFVLIVIFHVYFSFVFDLVALQDMTSFKAAFLYNLSPFIAALFSYLYLQEIMTLRKWLGLFIGFIGFLPELIAYAPQEDMRFTLFFLSQAEILMLISVISSVFGWIVVRGLIKNGYSPLVINGVGMFIGGVLALLTSPFFESWHPLPVTKIMPFIWLTLLIIFVSNIAGYNVQAYLLKKHTATFLTFAGFLSPLFAALFGWFFLGEYIPMRFFFSVVVVVIGLLLFYYEELRQGYIA